MREVEAVAKAKGLTVPEDTVDVLIKRCTDVGGAGLPSSMMADNLAGRPMEVEVGLVNTLRLVSLSWSFRWEL
jgi:ketopantoate reductase